MNVKKMTKTELYELAKTYDIKNRSKMSKEALIKSIEKYQEKVAPVEAPQTTSSAETVTSAMPEEKPEAPAPAKKPEYPIPDRYNIDTVVLLPVNPKKEYVYWEVADKTVDSICTKHNIGTPVFILKVFQSDNENKEELASVRVSKYGNWYFDLYCPDMNLWAEIGILDNKGNYYPVVNSKKIKMPTDTISKEIDKETWMSVGENIEHIFELSGISDVQKDELLSSARLHTELFKKLHEQEGLSSSALYKKGGE
ncbi:MAG: hypothetical protein C0602_07790 [Denitrovibrio sp.]|nr:MAG: hypothetical protein C0602_07790 [Denitrovibrio sp.]